MTNRHWWGAAICVPAIIALGWLVLPGDSGPENAAQVRIADNAQPPAPSPALAEGENPLHAERGRRPPTPEQRNADLAQESNYAFMREKRDAAWASRSEAAILAVMQRIAYVEQGRLLKIKCMASVCEVAGAAQEDPASGSMGPVWAALERDTSGGELRGIGLTRTATTFGTGRSREAFVIHYRRIDEAAR